MNGPLLLTVAETALRLRGADDRDARDFVRGLILEGRLAAIKHRGRWWVQARSLDDLATPKHSVRPRATPPRDVLVRRRVV